jgi:hypothetical protein
VQIAGMVLDCCKEASQYWRLWTSSDLGAGNRVP